MLVSYTTKSIPKIFLLVIKTIYQEPTKVVGVYDNQIHDDHKRVVRLLTSRSLIEKVS